MGKTYTPTINMRQSATDLGLAESTFPMMKKLQRERFDYILSLDADLTAGYHKYSRLRMDALERLQEIFYELEDKRELLKFSTFLYKKGLYGSKESWSHSAVKAIFRLEPRYIHHKTFLKKLEIIRVYEEYREYEAFGG